MEITPPALSCLHRAHQVEHANQVDKPKGAGERSQGRQNNSSHGQTADSWQSWGFSVFQLRVVPLLPNPAAFSTQPLFLNQEMIYTAHIGELMLPHRSQSQEEPSATQPLEKSPPGAPKLLQKDLCPCAFF